MSSDQQINIQIDHKDSSGNVKSSQSFKKRLNTASASNRISTVDKSFITAPLPFNVVMKAPIISTADRDVAALSDVSTDQGKIIYNSTTEDVEFWDGTDWISTGSAAGRGIDS